MDETESNLFSQIAQSRHVNLDHVRDRWEELHSVILRVTSLTAVLHSENDWTRILPLLRENTSLKKATLSIFRGTGTLEEMPMDALALAVQQSQLEHLILKRGPKVNIATTFFRALQHVRTLKTLEIYFPPDLEEYYALAEVIEKSELECFELQGQPFSFGTPLYPPPFVDAINKLVLAITRSASLRAVCLREMLHSSLTLCLEALLHNRSKLNKLALTCTVLKDDAVTLLADVLRTNTTLTDLQLTWCGLDTRKMTTLGDALRHNNTLQSLALRYHQLDIKELYNVLKANAGLTKLDLSDSHATNEDCKHIADILEHNTRLKSLILSSNKFEDGGIKAICRAMTKNSTLIDLRLDGNKCTFEGMTGVKTMLTCNTTLRSLDVSVNHVDVEQKTLLLYEGLKANTSLTKISIHLFVSQLKVLQDSLKEALKHNYALNTVVIKCATKNEPIVFIPEELIRNKQLQSEARFKVAILSHNIARSHEALSTLPHEIWLAILASITHPGLGSFKPLAEQIFSSYQMQP